MNRSLSSVVVLSATVVATSLVAVAAFRSLAPFVSPEDTVPHAPPGSATRAALEREKALVLRSIKELEFDHAMRKTATADFEEMRDRLKLRAVGLLRQLETPGYRDAVERDLAARSNVASPAPVVATASAAAVSPGRPAGAVPCVSCHTPNDPDARFCKNCGAALEALA